MIEKWLYNKLTTTASITLIFSDRIYQDFKYNIENMPCLVMYDIAEIYEKNNILKKSSKALKIVSTSKETNYNAIGTIINVFNSDIQTVYETNVIYMTKVLNSVTFWDESNQAWISTIDIEIIYQ